MNRKYDTGNFFYAVIIKVSQPTLPSPLEGEGQGEGDCRGLIHQTRLESNNKKILSSEEARRRFKLLRHKLMAMDSPQSKP